MFKMKSQTANKKAESVEKNWIQNKTTFIKNVTMIFM